MLEFDEDDEQPLSGNEEILEEKVIVPSKKRLNH